MTPLSVDARRGPSQARLSGFIALAIFIVVIIAFSWRGDSFAQVLGASCIGIAFIHSAKSVVAPKAFMAVMGSFRMAM